MNSALSLWFRLPVLFPYLKNDLEIIPLLSSPEYRVYYDLVPFQSLEKAGSLHMHHGDDGGWSQHPGELVVQQQLVGVGQVRDLLFRGTPVNNRGYSILDFEKNSFIHSFSLLTRLL